MQYHGVFTVYDARTDRFVEEFTVQCVHCNAHVHVAPGRTKGMGYCRNCMGWVCSGACQACVPWEARLENLEAGRPELTPPKLLVVGGWEDTDTPCTITSS